MERSKQCDEDWRQEFADAFAAKELQTEPEIDEHGRMVFASKKHSDNDS